MRQTNINEQFVVKLKNSITPGDHYLHLYVGGFIFLEDIEKASLFDSENEAIKWLEKRNIHLPSVIIMKKEEISKAILKEVPLPILPKIVNNKEASDKILSVRSKLLKLKKDLQLNGDAMGWINWDQIQKVTDNLFTAAYNINK